jgi:HD-like signal output (HDOD) protein
MLRPMRQAWEMAFVQSGNEALRVLEQTPFEVIVSDMRMPGMDGAALLTAVRARWPHMVRLALSGQSQQEAVLRSVGPTHQYLAKPCDAETLIGTVARACALRDVLADENLKRIVSQLTSLPSLPALYTAIVSELQSPQSSVQRVGAIITQDVSMSAKILQLVNSAFFGLRRHVASPTEAVCMLGLEAIKALVLSAHVFTQFRVVAREPVSFELLWQHNLATGTLAKRIAVCENAEPRVADHALMAGLLHDVGRLILVSQCPDTYAQVVELARREGGTLVQAEQRLLNTTHAAVGAYLLALWGLPDPIVEAVAYHHGPQQCPHPQFGVVTVVHIADVLADECHGVAGVEPVALDREHLRTLGLEAHIPVWRQACEVATARALS